MKTKILSLLVILSFLISCEDSEPETTQLDLSESLFENISYSETTLKVTITSNSSWTAASNVLWCTPDIQKYDGNYALTLNVSENLNQSTRSATITIKSGSITKTIQINQQAGKATGEHHYKLPVIFHVLYKDKNDNKQYVKEGRLAEILASVNKLFQDKVNSVDMNLEFTLATIDPSGKTLPEPGVERIPWETVSIDCEKFMSDNTGKYADLLWDPNQYINIMLYNFTSDGGTTITLGISHLPFITQTHFLDGLNETIHSQIELSQLKFPYSVSINSLYSERQSGDGMYDPLDVNVTLAHELGHYLGLLHAFSEGTGGNIDLCKDTDFCEDTPTYNRKEYQDWLDQNMKPNGSLSDVAIRYDCMTQKQYISHNVMDYTYSFTDQFTADQRERVRHVLTYSPLIPGPKMGLRETRTAPQGTLDLPIRYLK